MSTHRSAVHPPPAAPLCARHLFVRNALENVYIARARCRGAGSACIDPKGCTPQWRVKGIKPCHTRTQHTRAQESGGQKSVARLLAEGKRPHCGRGKGKRTRGDTAWGEGGFGRLPAAAARRLPRGRRPPVFGKMKGAKGGRGSRARSQVLMQSFWWGRRCARPGGGGQGRHCKQRGQVWREARTGGGRKGVKAGRGSRRGGVMRRLRRRRVSQSHS